MSFSIIYGFIAFSNKRVGIIGKGRGRIITIWLGIEEQPTGKFLPSLPYAGGDSGVIELLPTVWRIQWREQDVTVAIRIF